MEQVIELFAKKQREIDIINWTSHHFSERNVQVLKDAFNGSIKTVSLPFQIELHILEPHNSKLRTIPPLNAINIFICFPGAEEELGNSVLISSTLTSDSFNFCLNLINHLKVDLNNVREINSEQLKRFQNTDDFAEEEDDEILLPDGPLPQGDPSKIADEIIEASKRFWPKDER